MGLISSDHVYSYTQLDSIDSCPYNYYLSRIDKEGKANQIENAFSQQGSLIHDLLDKYCKGQLAKDALAAEYERRYANEVTCQWPRMLAAKGYTQKAFKIGYDFFNVHFKGFPGYKVIQTEQKFETNIGGRPFVGIIDAVFEQEFTGQLVVLDHKSKSLKAFKAEEDHMYRQQAIYSKYIYEKYGRFPDKMAFHLFKQEGVIFERPFDKTFYEETLAWAEAQIKKIEDYELIDFLEMKEVDFFCNELCGSRKICPNGKTKPRKKG